jgi:hypothetical protein
LSIAAFIISKRRFSFDTRLIGAKKTTEIRILFLDYKRKIEDFLRSVDAWEKVCRACEFYSEQSFTFYRQSAESFRKFADECLQALKSPVTQETAIILEPITAYGDDLCKRLASVTEMCRKSTENCRGKKREAMISEPSAPHYS